MGEQQAKELAEKQMQMGQGVLARNDVPEPRVLHIEAMRGGFLVINEPGALAFRDRQIIPNADCLLSFIQKWASEK